MVNILAHLVYLYHLNIFSHSGKREINRRIDRTRILTDNHNFKYDLQPISITRNSITLQTFYTCYVACKSSIIFPLIKKQGLDPEILKNFSKIIEKAIATQIHDHMILFIIFSLPIRQVTAVKLLC